MSPSLFVLIPALACAIFALIFGHGAVSRRQWHRRGSSRRAIQAMLALAFGLVALGLLSLALLVRHYNALSGEVVIAELSMDQLGPQRFQVRIVLADGHERSVLLVGDEWQLDARVLTWRLPAMLAGAPPLYRVERISGRYLDIAQAREGERSVHGLAAAGGLDLGLLKQEFPRYLPFVDARFGSAAYLPMLDGARYVVSFSGQGGLVARPADEASARLLEAAGWH